MDAPRDMTAAHGVGERRMLLRDLLRRQHLPGGADAVLAPHRGRELRLVRIEPQDALAQHRGREQVRILVDPARPFRVARARQREDVLVVLVGQPDRDALELPDPAQFVVGQRLLPVHVPAELRHAAPEQVVHRQRNLPVVVVVHLRQREHPRVVAAVAAPVCRPRVGRAGLRACIDEMHRVAFLLQPVPCHEIDEPRADQQDLRAPADRAWHRRFVALDAAAQRVPDPAGLEQFERVDVSLAQRLADRLQGHAVAGLDLARRRVVEQILRIRIGNHDAYDVDLRRARRRPVVDRLAGHRIARDQRVDAALDERAREHVLALVQQVRAVDHVVGEQCVLQRLVQHI
nr:hypothetical protein [Burkholderia ambifaria]